MWLAARSVEAQLEGTSKPLAVPLCHTLASYINGFQMSSNIHIHASASVLLSLHRITTIEHLPTLSNARRREDPDQESPSFPAHWAPWRLETDCGVRKPSSWITSDSVSSTNDNILIRAQNQSIKNLSMFPRVRCSRKRDSPQHMPSSNGLDPDLDSGLGPTSIAKGLSPPSST